MMHDAVIPKSFYGSAGKITAIGAGINIPGSGAILDLARAAKILSLAAFAIIIRELGAFSFVLAGKAGNMLPVLRNKSSPDRALFAV